MKQLNSHNTKTPTPHDMKILESDLVEAAQFITDSRHEYEDYKDNMTRGEDGHISITVHTDNDRNKHIAFVVSIKIGDIELIVYERIWNAEAPRIFRKGLWTDYVSALASERRHADSRKRRFREANPSLADIDCIDDRAIFAAVNRKEN